MESVHQDDSPHKTLEALPMILLDVRSPSEFAAGGLPGAINVPYESVAQYVEGNNDISKDTDITLYCRSGRRSAIALNALKELGFRHVRDIGGLEEARTVLEKGRNIGVQN